MQLVLLINVRYIKAISLSVFLFLSGWACTAQNQPDTVLHVKMKTVNINAEREWDNDTARYRYNQTRYYITTILPYLNEVVDRHNTMQEKIASEQGWDRRTKKRYLKAQEEELREQYESDIKQLNETQGVLLVKLISRQTGENIYHLLLDYKSRLSATKWLGWAAVNGFNLNKQYDPSDEPMIENIMENLDYPLPEFYNQEQILTVN